MNGNSGDPGKLRRERKLLHNCGSVGESFYKFRVTEPEIQIKIIRHA
jgi:hypothetical protein